MRRLLIAGAALAAGAAVQADAQRRVVVQGPGASYPVPGRTVVTQSSPQVAPPVHVAPHGVPHARGPRWQKVGGRWVGGVNAPGGYAAYRRPVRGYTVPVYWNAPGFHVTDWSSYGLPQPPAGYHWSRYYDDAVLIDGRGTVYDAQYGLDWDRHDRTYYAGGDPIAEGPVYHSGAAYPPPPPPQGNFDPRLYRRPDTGLGGAAIGAAAGGALGAVVAGRGDRLGGALIGAGVGAVTGYAVDKAEDRGRVPPPPAYGTYGAPYPAPAYDGYGYAPPPPPTVQTYTIQPGATQTIYVPAGVTTITVQSQPVATTTTTVTEYMDEAVTYTTPAPRVRHKRVYRSKLKPRCNC